MSGVHAQRSFQIIGNISTFKLARQMAGYSVSLNAKLWVARLGAITPVP
jgi:hypothetical protein